MTVRIRYETHGVTADNARHVMSGWNDPVLSEAGVEGARQLGSRQVWDGPASVDVVATSDLRRAVQTADIALAGRPVERVVDRRLRECDFGCLNGAPLTEIERLRPHHVDLPFPGGQSLRDVVAATAGLLSDWQSRFAGRTVLVIAHSANKWALDVLLHDEQLEDLASVPFQWLPGWSYELPDGWRPRDDATTAQGRR